MHVFLDAKVRQHLCGVAFSFPAVHLGKFLFELSSTVAVGFCHLCFRIESFALFHVLPERGVAHEHGVEHAIGVIFEVVLLQHGEALAGTKLYGTLVGLKVAADGTEKGRLARSVSTNDTINVSGSEFDVYILVQNSFAKLNGQVGNCNHY